jgi:two-component system, cell cycle response regulator DivK
MQEPRAPLKTVLVVEDYADSRLLLRHLLEMSGYRVLEAADGREAVRVAELECPDLILMDLQMPVLDGFTATSLIRRIESICRIPVVAVSALCSREFISAAATVGFNHFIPKPVDVDLLLAVVRECTEGAGARVYSAPPDSLTIRQLCV